MTTLVFTTSTNFVSKAIRWFTRSRASHVMLGIEIFGQPFLLHSTAGGVQITPRSKWMKENTLVSEFRFKPDISGGVQNALQLLGTKYDYLTLFGWGFAILMWRYLRVKVKNPLKSPTAVVCSEFVMRINDHTTYIPEWAGLDPEETHAQDLLDHISPLSFERLT